MPTGSKVDLVTALGSLGFEDDAVAELLQTMGEAALDTGSVALVEVVGPEVLVLGPARQQVIGDHQDRMRDGDRGLLLAAPCCDAAELGRQVRVAFPRGSVRGLDQDAAQGAVALAGPSTARFPALSSWPGVRPAQAASWPELGKRVQSGPTSASSASAVARPTPGI